MKCKTCGATQVDSDCKWLKIPELKIEVEMEVHDKGRSWNDLKLSEKEDQLLTVEQVIWLANSKYADKLGFNKDEGFFIRQPFDHNKKKGYIAVFRHLDWDLDDYGPFSLYASWGGPDGRFDGVGVRSCRKITKSGAFRKKAIK